MTCSCTCPKQTTRTKYWYVKCTVATTYDISLKLSAYENYTKDFWRGVYGHEQAHVRSRNLFVKTNVIDSLATKTDKFAHQKSCEDAAGLTNGKEGYMQEYQTALNRQMEGKNHKGEDKWNSESPTSGVGQTPTGDPP